MMIDIKKKSNCCGCSACSDTCPVNAIEMIENERGFKYPNVDKKCVNCHKCESVCVMRKNGGGIPLGDLYALQHKNNDVLQESSSGGAFTAISDAILSIGGVVYGACINPFDFRVKHICALDKETRNTMRGSKYVQSECSIYKKIAKDIEDGRQVLFSGTPCECAALISFLGDRPENLLVIDVLCHGVSSDLLLRDHVKFWEGKKRKKAVNYKFRSKKYGYEYTQEITFDDGSSDSDVGLRQILKLYPLSMRDSCYECKFASNTRFGDFTIGDLWEAPKTVHIYDHKGVSVLAVNSEKGKLLLDDLKESCKLIPILKSQLTQNAIRKPMERPVLTDDFWKDYLSRGYGYVVDKYARPSKKSIIYQQYIRFVYRLHLDSLRERVKGLK